MIERIYDGSLEGLFAILDELRRAAPGAAGEPILPDRIRRIGHSGPGLTGGPDRTAAVQPDLFGDYPNGALPEPAYAPESSDRAAEELREISVNAYDRFVCGWMSELPIEAELIRFAWKVLSAARNVPGGLQSPEARNAAERAASDRGDPAAAAVLAAAYKVWKETDRLRGLLRFSPNPAGVHLARCAPDHFVLPALAEHFTPRFGETPWAIIDERRSLALVRTNGGEARLIPLETFTGSFAVPEDPWELLWQNYHRSINNESRSNLRLQQQFIPSRYRKYLPELTD